FARPVGEHAIDVIAVALHRPQYTAQSRGAATCSPLSFFTSSMSMLHEPPPAMKTATQPPTLRWDCGVQCHHPPSSLCDPGSHREYDRRLLRRGLRDGQAYCRRTSSGVSAMVAVAPLPGTLVSVREPWCWARMPRAMESPSPAPPRSRARAASARK